LSLVGFAVAVIYHLMYTIAILYAILRYVTAEKHRVESR
jgi:hypothetical protein